MRVFVFMCFTLLTLTGCKNNEKGVANENISGEVLFTEMQCTTCHLPSQKIVGSSILQMKNAYSNEESSIAAFLNGEAEPIIDPSQYDIMKINIEETKKRTPQERKAIEAYIMGFK